MPRGITDDLAGCSRIRSSCPSLWYGFIETVKPIQEGSMEAGHDHEVEITVNRQPVDVPKQTTGAEIKSRASVDASWQLFRIQGDHEIVIGDAEAVRATPNEKFIATPVLEPA